MTEKLRHKYTATTDAVASVFVQKDVTSGDNAFVEDVLTSMFKQLYLNGSEDEAVFAKYRLYLDARKNGHRDLFRIQIIREAISLLISKLDHAFVVIDDFDRCSPTADLFLENELSLLADQGLKILLTSRIAWLKTLPEDAQCDSCVKEDQKDLSVYWSCASCEGNGVEHRYTHILCEDCKEKGKTCFNWYVTTDF